MRELLAHLPKVDKVMQEAVIKAWEAELDQDYIKETIQLEIDKIRQAILDGAIEDPDIVQFDRVVNQVNDALTLRIQPSLKPVINATGTVLHTNLGRAPLSEEVVEAIADLAPSYSNLEYDLAEGKRGSRYVHLKDVLKQITGAEDALVVNNNAAAVLLMLSALTENQEVLISRGELVEIGGSFRIPDVITRGGAQLREVGATNKTHLKDYQQAMSDQTGAILRVHTSNYRLVGFTDHVADADLVALAHDQQALALNDLGSGLFLDMQQFGLPYEPTVQEAIQAGFDVVTFSGDKLLGGPQAGIIVGKKALLDKIRSHPLTRALRTDKVTLVALEVTMRQYLNPELALEKIPVLQKISQSLERLQEKADYMIQAINNLSADWQAERKDGQSQIGGGSYPGSTLPTALVQISQGNCSAAQLEHYLRTRHKPIIARVQQDYVQFDVRTLLDREMDEIIQVLKEM